MQRCCTLRFAAMVHTAGQYGLRARRSGHSRRDAGISAEEVPLGMCSRSRVTHSKAPCTLISPKGWEAAPAAMLLLHDHVVCCRWASQQRRRR